MEGNAKDFALGLIKQKKFDRTFNANEGKTIIIKSKDNRYLFQAFDSEFERKELLYEIQSLIESETAEDDDNADWWKK